MNDLLVPDPLSLLGHEQRRLLPGRFDQEARPIPRSQGLTLRNEVDSVVVVALPCGVPGPQGIEVDQGLRSASFGVSRRCLEIVVTALGDGDMDRCRFSRRVRTRDCPLAGRNDIARGLPLVETSTLRSPGARPLDAGEAEVDG